jgi:hypothetical protein
MRTVTFTKQHRQNYAQIGTESKLLALTGLKRNAFAALCAEFGHHWQAYIAVYRLNGEKRQRRVSNKVTDVLPKDEDKLFFILKYLKTNPLQEELAHDFALSQAHANLWIHALRVVLRTTLKAMRLAPARNSAELSERLPEELVAYEYLLADGSERLIERPQDAAEQRAAYSGKKKRKQ